MKKEFLLQVALSNTQSASFQRGYVYNPQASSQERGVFVKEFLNKLRELEVKYSRPVSEKDHILNIQVFADDLSKRFPDVLFKGKFRIGISQKAVNLYLKFLWCYGYIPEPPHCPIDRVILKKISSPKNWTMIDKIEEYEEIISTLKTCCGDTSLSQWEYDLFNT